MADGETVGPSHIRPTLKPFNPSTMLALKDFALGLCAGFIAFILYILLAA